MRSTLVSIAYGSAFIVLLSLLFLIRLVWVIHLTHAKEAIPVRKRSKDEQVSLAVFLGSGGHTAEMIRFLQGMNWDRYSTRVYVISKDDRMSETKVTELEKMIGRGSFRFLRIPRARIVQQSILTSPFTTLHSFIHCLAGITFASYSKQESSQNDSTKPVPSMLADVILLNGPGSCVPIAIASFLPRVLGLPSPKVIYIESFARTRRLSLSGRLVRPFVDRFFVQWESLRNNLAEQDSLGGGKLVKLKLKAKVEYDGWLV